MNLFSIDDNGNYWTGFYCIACREEQDLNPDNSIPYNEANNERPKGTVIDLLSECVIGELNPKIVVYRLMRQII